MKRPSDIAREMLAYAKDTYGHGDDTGVGYVIVVADADGKIAMSAHTPSRDDTKAMLLAAAKGNHVPAIARGGN